MTFKKRTNRVIQDDIATLYSLQVSRKEMWSFENEELTELMRDTEDLVRAYLLPEFLLQDFYYKGNWLRIQKIEATYPYNRFQNEILKIAVGETDCVEPLLEVRKQFKTYFERTKGFSTIAIMEPTTLIRDGQI